MKSLLTKLLALSLALLMLVAGAACSNQGEGDTTTDEANASADVTEPQTESPYDENGYLKDSLDPSLNFKDSEFNILYWSDREHEEYVVESQNGDLVNDAIYDRNLKVEERLGVKFNFIGCKGNASTKQEFLNAVDNSYKASDHAYDMVSAHSMCLGLVASEGLLLDLNTCDYLDWEKPWWPETLINEATISNRLFFASGDISANVIYMMYVTFFNKQMLDDLQLESPYDLVEKNQWTLDKMQELAQGIYLDSNGDGKVNLGDTFGEYAYTLHLDAYLIGSGIRIIDTANNTLSLDASFVDEKADNLTTQLSKYFHDNSRAFLITANKTVHQYFSAGQSLFWTDRCRQAITFKEKEATFGIVPVPKWNSEQTNYATCLGNPFSLYGIMVDCAEADRSAAVMECYASESYRILSPALYETTMKYRFTDDAVSSRMFDIVRATVIFDMGRIFASTLSTPCSTWENAVTNSDSWKVASKPQSNIWKKNIEILNDLFLNG